MELCLKLSIIYLHQYFNTPDMSGGTRSYELARRLVAKGHRVELITTDRTDGKGGDGKWRVTQENGIIVHWCSVPYSNNMGFFSRVKAFFAFAYAATKRVKSIKADLVFATSTPLTIALPGIFKRWRSKIPMVFEVRDLWPELPIAIGMLKNPILKFFAKLLEKWAYMNSEAIIALSPGMRDGIIAAGYDKHRVSVIPNACDREAFLIEREKVEMFRKERSWLGEKPVLIYAGTLGKINGVGYLVEIASSLAKHNSPVQILIVGEGAEREKITAQANAAGVLGKNLFIENYLPKNQMAALFGAADISASLFVDLPEMRANSANKFFDALAAGRPILINYGGWQARVLRESGAGLVAPPDQPRVALEQAEELLGAPERLAQASEAAEKLAREQFDRDLLAGRLAEVLNEVHARWKIRHARA